MRNDDFLHALRRKPSAAFAARLKARLDLQGAITGERRLSVVRVLAPIILLGGAVWAAAFLFRGDVDVLTQTDSSLDQTPLSATRLESTQQDATPEQSPGAFSEPSIALQLSLDDTFNAAPDTQVSVKTRVFPLSESHEPLTPLSQQTSRVNRDLEPVGHVALVVASRNGSQTQFLSARHLYLASAKYIPDPVNPAYSIPNPYRTWRSIDPALAAAPIHVSGPAQNSVLFTVFLDLIMEEGCDYWPSIRALKAQDPTRYKQLCHMLRDDGAYITLPAWREMTVNAVPPNEGAITILSYPFYAENRNVFGPSLLAGTVPDSNAIASGRYGASRAVYAQVDTGRTWSNEIAGLLLRGQRQISDRPYGYLATSEGLTELD